MDAAPAAALTLLAIGQVPGAFSTFLPSPMQLALVDDDPAVVEQLVRRGELQAVALAVALGAGSAILARTPWPFLGTLVMVGVMLREIELALCRCVAPT